MKNKEIDRNNKVAENILDSNLWGVEILRDNLLNDILGQDNHDILYWAGKNLSLKFPVQTESLPTFFAKSKFGNLELIKHSEIKSTVSLSGEIIERRLKNDKDADFALETGYIAQTIQQNTGFETEAEYNIKRKKTVEINVVSDVSKQIFNPEIVNPLPLNQTTDSETE
ncbi:YslB family protein [Fructilactobacillus vespulae]|uniref:YslB family protein n=1 Tax=Fructilactobacillus vespulae TaxID=1249630 RepID=UPI0039B51E51